MSDLSGFVKRLRDIMRNDAGINGDAQRIEQITRPLFLKAYDTKEQGWKFDDENDQSTIPEPCRWASWARDDKSGSAMTGDVLPDFVNNKLFPVPKGKDGKDRDGSVIIKGVKADAFIPIRQTIVQSTFADASNYMKDGVLLCQVINAIDGLDLGDCEESHAFGEIYESILKELQKQVPSTAGAKKYGKSIYGVEKSSFPICCASQTCRTTWTCPRCTMKIPFCGMCRTIPQQDG